jgi:DNA-binding response OmpR family regulator
VRYPQVLVCESDGHLAALLREVAERRKWSLREPQQLAACLRLLRRAVPSVLVLKVGRDLEHDLSLLERVAWLRPDAGLVVVGDTDHAALAGLAWDLGADFVLLPPLPRELLPDIVAGLMRRGPAEEARPGEP